MSNQSPTVQADQHLVDFHNSLSASIANSSIVSEKITPKEEIARVQNVDTADMVQQVQRQIQAVEAKMLTLKGSRDGVLKADPRTMQALEIERAHLLTTVLPYTQSRAADIQRLQAIKPSTSQTLQTEVDRRQRLELAAIKRAEELEVEEMAQRLRSQRRQNGGA
jgi:uncharacterized protein YcbK (DUF882 family)